MYEIDGLLFSHCLYDTKIQISKGEILYTVSEYKAMTQQGHFLLFRVHCRQQISFVVFKQEGV